MTEPASLYLPLLVFVAELTVVTLGTLRIIFLARGMKLLAPLLGFFEVCIWLFAIGQIMNNLDNLGCYIGFAAGFTAGNFLGMTVEKKLAMGTALVQIITNHDAGVLVERLAEAGYGVTSIPGQGATGPVTIVFTVIKRRERRNVEQIITRFDSRAFYSVDEIQTAAAGIFPAKRRALNFLPAQRVRPAA